MQYTTITLSTFDRK